jgi:hypothetical protein
MRSAFWFLPGILDHLAELWTTSNGIKIMAIQRQKNENDALTDVVHPAPMGKFAGVASLREWIT